MLLRYQIGSGEIEIIYVYYNTPYYYYQTYYNK